ncbi:hypothetical protein KUTeg_002386 [Tegillarca granosa]|uniref:Anion exchange protein n=1 Tax=Tegillarca granosa TaxID=220873 RepID=A0ABQ9FU64_TEGGR|nr:hypothetical protein KUTeg_002386 [Tegillarca granosa]
MDQRNPQNQPIRDLGSFVGHIPSDADIKDHRSERTGTVFIGLHVPNKRRRRHRHKHHKRSDLERIQNGESSFIDATPPSQRIQFLLGEDEDDDDHKTHDVFCEMEELFYKDDEMEWKETARWVKFEEDVEEGGERWSKPHVATLSLHSLFELRCLILNGTVILDTDATLLPQVVDIVLDNMVASKQLEEDLKDSVRDVLMLRHRHQNQKKHRHDEGKSSRYHLPNIRSLADIGKKYSEPKFLNNHHVTSTDCLDKQGLQTLAIFVIKSAQDQLNLRILLQMLVFFYIKNINLYLHDIFNVLERSPTPPGDNDTGRRGFPGAKSTPNFMMPRENSVPKFEHSYTQAADLHQNSSSADLLENQSQHKILFNYWYSNIHNLPIYFKLKFPHVKYKQIINRKNLSICFIDIYLVAIRDTCIFIVTKKKFTLYCIFNITCKYAILDPILNLHFMKKIPPGSEAANILVGEVKFLTHPIVAFVRLSKSEIMGDLTEVPVPTKFLFFLLGPYGNQSKFHEIGRSIATLMSDEIFHDVAYHARQREDLLAGIDEFLDQVTVLPPGEWDPSIRIEPPKSVPSQEGRKTAAGPPLPNGKAIVEEEEESHGNDPTLQRTGRLFGGLIKDLKRKIPFYPSDFKDCLSVQCIASFVFLYFACLTPIITFGGLLADATDKNMAALESLLAGAVCGIVYALFSGQPLTILGSTGPVLVFETILNQESGLNYLEFRLWIGLWTGAILIVMVALDLSALVRYITRFTEESFALLISLIFIKEAFAKLFHIIDEHPIKTDLDTVCWCIPAPSNTTGVNSTLSNATDYNISTTTAVTSTLYVLPNNTNTSIHWPSVSEHECQDLGGMLVGDGCGHVADVFFLSVILFFGTFVISMGLKMLRNSRFFPNKIRSLLNDFAVLIAIISMVGLDAGVGLKTPKLEVPEDFTPTKPGRGWVVVPFLFNPWWTCLAALIPAMLATILIFMDQQITAVIVNRKENKLEKGCGYHLDLLIVAILIIVNSFLGLPYFVAATVLSINHVMSLKKESECTAPGERPKFLGVREQRVTGFTIFLMIGLSVLLTSVLKFIPMPVLYGVFLYMGVSSLRGMQVVDRILILLMPPKYQPDYLYLRHVRTRRVHIFTGFQILCLACLWVIKTIKEISIAFPLMVLAMCFVRKGLDWVFTQNELKWLDDIMPETHKRAKEDEKIKQDELEEQEKKKFQDEVDDGPDKDRFINLAVQGSTVGWEMDSVNITEEMHKKKRSPHIGSDLPTIPHSPTEKRSTKKKQPVTFFIEEGEEEQLLNKAPEIVVDPPSDNTSINRDDESIA